MLQAAKPVERVPYFTFELREVGEDAEASKEKGYPVPKVIPFILITPHGHKGDPLEFAAQEFIERKEREAANGIYDHSWVKDYKAGFEAFLDGRVIPRNGIPTLTWERLAKKRREQLAKLFPTLEDIAAVPDSSITQLIGLDGRVIRDLALGDIQSRKTLEPVVAELAEMKEENRRLGDRNTSLEEQIKQLMAKVDALTNAVNQKK